MDVLSNRFRWFRHLLAVPLLAASPFAQTPGDGAPLAGVHPGYDIMNLLPTGLQPGVSGMDFFSDGRLAISTWGGNHDALVPPSQKGEVYVFSNVAGTDPAQITYKKFASGLQEPLGLKVVNDTIYVSERTAVAMLVDKDKDGVMDADGYKKWVTYTSGAARHEFFFGLAYHDGYFYGSHSLSLNSGASFVPQPDANRGTYVRIQKSTAKSEYISGGAREPFGIGVNPMGEVFSTEVQGSWNPACAFTQVKPGRFYGHPLLQQVPKSPFDDMPYLAPAVLLPQSEIANAPGQPIYLDKGPFQGQYLYGDVRYGGVQRVYLEKVAGEYQGAVFRFSAGFMGGVSRLALGSNGDIYVGQIGDPSGDWIEIGKKTWGLQRLRANGKTAFEILSLRSRPTGMELEFTEPVAADANLTARYVVKTWTYTRTSEYGGPKVDSKTLTVSSVQVSPDKKKVYLEVAGLKKGYVVHVRLAGLKSADAKTPWSAESWYTLNNFGTGNPFDPVVSAREPGSKAPAGGFEMSRAAGKTILRVTSGGPYALRVMDIRGILRAEFRGDGSGVHSLAGSGLAPGMYTVTLSLPSGNVSRPLVWF